MSIDKAFQIFPEFETKNLILRRMHCADAGALFEILADEEVTEFYDDDAFSDISQASDQIEAWENGFKNKRCIRWGITRKGEGYLLGSCGYYGFQPWYQRASIGYELGRDSWRQGIMTEALRAMIDFGFGDMGLNRIEAVVMPGNTASLKMLEKLGFRKEGLLGEYEKWGSKGFVDLCMFAVLRKAWTHLDKG
ncbi:MAG: GNAT family N-acetyltransferase [Anaerolineales bacterium]|nr:GNAT family N-acetyltransferase [Anaerolineales bacterium]